MKILDILFGTGDLLAIFFSLMRILGGDADLGVYIWLTVAILWGIELILMWKEKAKNK